VAGASFRSLGGLSGSERGATIREAYEAFSRGDLDAVVELLDPEVELRPPPDSTDPEPRHGREAVRQYLTPNLFASQSAQPEEILDRGDRVLVVATVKARGVGSGIEIEDTAFHLWTVRDKLAVRFEVFVNGAQALAALED
jgi:uncharacterized protein